MNTHKKIKKFYPKFWGDKMTKRWKKISNRIVRHTKIEV